MLWDTEREVAEEVEACGGAEEGTVKGGKVGRLDWVGVSV